MPEGFSDSKIVIHVVPTGDVVACLRGPGDEYIGTFPGSGGREGFLVRFQNRSAAEERIAQLHVLHVNTLPDGVYLGRYGYQVVNFTGSSYVVIRDRFGNPSYEVDYCNGGGQSRKEETRKETLWHDV